MTDLISRHRLMSVIKPMVGIFAADDEFYISYNAVLNAIEYAPTIDAVPVVRCKDCKHWGMHKRLNVPWCFEMHIDKCEDGYCDSGERREDATD